MKEKGRNTEQIFDIVRISVLKIFLQTFTLQIGLKKFL